MDLGRVEGAALNRLFQEQGVTGQPGRITAETVRHGERKNNRATCRGSFTMKRSKKKNEQALQKTAQKPADSKVLQFVREGKATVQWNGQSTSHGL
jgi:hypothetical protein